MECWKPLSDKEYLLFYIEGNFTYHLEKMCCSTQWVNDKANQRLWHCLTGFAEITLTVSWETSDQGKTKASRPVGEAVRKTMTVEIDWKDT